MVRIEEQDMVMTTEIAMDDFDDYRERRGEWWWHAEIDMDDFDD